MFAVSKRLVAAFCLCLSFITFMMFRLFYLSQGGALTTVAERQSSLVLTVGASRGNIYDCNFQSLTGGKMRYVAAVTPGQEATAALTKLLPVWERGKLSGLLESGKPFTIEVPGEDVDAKGIRVFAIPQRNSAALAVQTCGYLDAAGQGVYGIEKAYNDLLNSYGSTVRLKYQVDAFGRVLDGIDPVVDGSTGGTGGVVLTLDSQFQAAAEQASEFIEKGAVVVMDAWTGEIKAMVSRPFFDPQNLSQSLSDPNSPFINRAASAFAVGSSFKLAVAAAALDSGTSPDRTYTCKGFVELDEQVFKCNNLAGHGELNLEQAINKSCNTYFITLAREVGGEHLHRVAASMGFGSPNQLASGMITAKGNLPSVSQLIKGELANFGFGQGLLTATPLQIAQMTATVANGGYSVVPKLVMGETADGLHLDKPSVEYARSRVISAETAALLREYMISTVEVGSGAAAKPEAGGAGGKTASAQTGVFDEQGQEVVHAWFTGFFPAENPRYVCVVLCEGGTSGSKAAAPVFKKIADAVSFFG